MNFETLWTEYNSSLEKVILSFLIGAVIASVMILYNKRAVGGFVRALLKKGAADETTAVTLAEAGYSRAAFIFASLKNPDSVLRRVVSVTGSKEKINSNELKNARFYISEDNRYKAESRYDGKNTSIPVLILTVIALTVVAYLCIKYIPQLIALFN